MNKDDALLERIRAKIREPPRRGPRVFRRTPLPPPASADVLRRTERQLGFQLHPFHHRTLHEVGNGGFGPNSGVVGVEGGYPGPNGETMVDLRSHVNLARDDRALPAGLVPLLDWTGVWSCLDCSTGLVLSVSADGIFDPGIHIQDWWEPWLVGGSVADQMWEFELREDTSPITKKLVKHRFRKRLLGVRCP